MIRSRPILLAAVAASLAGFLFGFDTIVISGADRPIQLLWDTSDWFHGTFIMSMALWGTVIGALLGGVPCDRLGRKRTLFWIGVLYLASALGSALAPGPWSFSAARFVGGLAVGASSVAAPIYVSEITPADRRGGLVALYQFNIVLGVLVAYVSNFLIGASLGEGAWRWMLGVEAVPAAAYSLFVLGIPNSPRWLAVRKADPEGALTVLRRLHPGEDAAALLHAIEASARRAAGAAFRPGRYRVPILLAVLLAFFNQMSGINFVLYYAPRIFEQAGIAAADVLGASIPLGVVNLVFTLLGMYLIDRVGRKQLMYWGSLGYIASLAGVSWAFFSGAEGAVVVAFVSAFIAAHAVGQGTVIWVFISEVFPNAVRDYGMALGSGTHWVLAASITLVTPAVLATFAGGEIFAFFAGMMVLQLLFVWKVMPETKGRSLEELEAILLPEDAAVGG